tara:strand:+ start:6424 stop:6582 length:159 start_codon:yes stop_codon:yes gene_type:complete
MTVELTQFEIEELMESIEWIVDDYNHEYDDEDKYLHRGIVSAYYKLEKAISQ